MGPNILPGLRPDATGALFVGIHASVKHDSTVLVCVNTISTATIWSWPIIALAAGLGAPMDVEATIEFYLCRLQGWNTSIEKILVNPFQMHRTITTLQAAGLPIERRDKCK